MMSLTKTELADLLSDNLALFEFDPKTGKIVWANKNLEYMFGYQTLPGSLEGQPIELLVPESLRDVHAKVHVPAFLAAPESRFMGHGPLQGQRKDGTTFPVMVKLFMRVANTVTLVYGMVIDLLPAPPGAR